IRTVASCSNSLLTREKSGNTVSRTDRLSPRKLTLEFQKSTSGGNMNYKYAFFVTLLISGVLVLVSRSAPPQEKPRTPAEGHDIHVLAPHQIDGQVMGPYHHHCKAVSNEVLEFLIYESTEPNALLKQVEYFVLKRVSRPNVPLEIWNNL